MNTFTKRISLILLTITFTTTSPHISLAGFFDFTKSQKERFPFVEAAKQGDYTTIEKLLSTNPQQINNLNSTGRTALIEAANQGYTYLIQTLINAGANLNIADKKGQTALHIAAKKGYADITQLLIHSGANTDIRDKYNLTALDHAIEANNRAVIKTISPTTLKTLNTKVIAKQSIDDTTTSFLDFFKRKKNNNPLIDAATEGNTELVTELITQQPSLINKTNNKQNTALIEATKAGHANIVQSLITAGADINKTDSHGRTALHWAAKQNDTSITSLLVQNNIDIEIVDKYGFTALQHAVKSKNIKIINTIDPTALASVETKTTFSNNTQNIQQVTTPTPQKKQKNSGFFSKLFSSKKPQTPLINASVNGNIEITTELLKDATIDINQTNKNGQTALIIAAQNGHTQITQSLINHNAQTNIIDNHGRTALHWASKNGYADITQLLIQNNADINIIDKYGYTALQYAIKSENIAVINSIDSEALTIVETEAALPAAAAAASGGLFGMSTTATIATVGGVAAAGAGAAIVASNSSSDSTSTTSTPSSQNNDHQTFETGDYLAQYGLSKIKASHAYARGYTGSGIKVAVIDTGVQATHLDLAGNVLPGIHYFNNGTSLDSNSNYDTSPNPGNNSLRDIDFHGTHVAGIIAAHRGNGGSHGVAYNAQILPIRVFTDGSATTGDVTSGLTYATNNGARVINMSLGTTSDVPSLKTAITNAMNAGNGTVIVAANGNAKQIVSHGNEVIFATPAANPLFPARYARDVNTNNTKGALIAVGATNSNNTITSFSFRCGDAKEWCMVAPGENIVSDIPDGTYYASDGTVSAEIPASHAFYPLSGTSMATPHVAGAAAILLQKSPHLTGKQIAEILLSTATDLGAPGTDDIYGRGLLNLDAATAPIGTTKIPLGNHISNNFLTLPGSEIITSSAFGDAINNSQLEFAMFDQYNRSYAINFNSITTTHTTLDTIENSLSNFAQNHFDSTTKLSDNTTLSIASIVETNISKKNDGYERTEKPIQRMSLVSQFNKTRTAFNYNIPMDQAFKPLAFNNSAHITDINPLPTSILSLAKHGISQSTQFTPSANHKFSFGSFFSEEDEGNIFGFVNGYSHTYKNNTFGIQLGMLNEENTFLGSKGSGAFSINNNTPSWFSNLSANLPITNDIALFGTYNHNLSFPKINQSSLLQEISHIQSTAFNIGISKQNLLTQKDKAGLMLSQPTRVISGNAKLDLPMARDQVGNIYRQSFDLNLTPSGQELDIGLFYSKNTSQHSSLDATAMYRTQPGHNKYAAPDTVVMFKYSINF